MLGHGRRAIGPAQAADDGHGQHHERGADHDERGRDAERPGQDARDARTDPHPRHPQGLHDPEHAREHGVVDDPLQHRASDDVEHGDRAARHHGRGDHGRDGARARAGDAGSQHQDGGHHRGPEPPPPTSATDPAAPTRAPMPAAVCSAPTPAWPRPSTSMATDTSNTSNAPHAIVISAAIHTSSRGPRSRAIDANPWPASASRSHGRSGPGSDGVVRDAEREHGGGRRSPAARRRRGRRALPRRPPGAPSPTPSRGCRRGRRPSTRPSSPPSPRRASRRGRASASDGRAARWSSWPSPRPPPRTRSLSGASRTIAAPVRPVAIAWAR